MRSAMLRARIGRKERMSEYADADAPLNALQHPEILATQRRLGSLELRHVMWETAVACGA